jgi:hypothetical protein
MHFSTFLEQLAEVNDNYVNVHLLLTGAACIQLMIANKKLKGLRVIYGNLVTRDLESLRLGSYSTSFPEDWNRLRRACIDQVMDEVSFWEKTVL